MTYIRVISRPRKYVISGRHEYKEDLNRESLEFSGEAVHKGLSPASLLPMEPAKHEISGYDKASDLTSTWTFSFLTTQLSSSVFRAQIAHPHKTFSILSVIRGICNVISKIIREKVSDLKKDTDRPCPEILFFFIKNSGIPKG